jgi:hypothetical protein
VRGLPAHSQMAEVYRIMEDMPAAIDYVERALYVLEVRTGYSRVTCCVLMHTHSLVRTLTHSLTRSLMHALTRSLTQTPTR